ncbi:MAG: hypothetical protein R2880_10525 [Deinococcales bacterium]
MRKTMVLGYKKLISNQPMVAEGFGILGDIAIDCTTAVVTNGNALYEQSIDIFTIPRTSACTN